MKSAAEIVVVLLVLFTGGLHCFDTPCGPMNEGICVLSEECQETLGAASLDSDCSPRQRPYHNTMVCCKRGASHILQASVEASVQATHGSSCITPNGDNGICVDVSECPTLLDRSTSYLNSLDFYRKSSCGSKEGQKNLVCCGKYNVYIASEGDVAMPCTTPNGDLGWCIKTNNCAVVKQSKGNSQFVKESIEKCSQGNSKSFICCGKYGNYRNKPQSTQVSSVLPEQCGAVPISTRIIGGEESELGEFPWMARLIRRYNNSNLKFSSCSGFLVTRRHVITAAHCIVSKQLNEIGQLEEVLLGEHDVMRGIDCRKEGKECAPKAQSLPIESSVAHGGYQRGSRNRHNDIGIITLKTPAQLNDYVQPICLLRQPVELEESEFWLAGWGSTEDKETSDVLMKVSVPKVNFLDCVETYSSINIKLVETQICAGGNKKDSCTGDSGGPLMLQRDGVWFAAGVISFGLGCGIESWPAVYTSLPPYISWIERRIAASNRRLRSRYS